MRNLKLNIQRRRVKYGFVRVSPGKWIYNAMWFVSQGGIDLFYNGLDYIPIELAEQDNSEIILQRRNNFCRFLEEDAEVAILFDDDGNVVAISKGFGSDIWFDAADNYTPKHFSELGINIISLKAL